MPDAFPIPKIKSPQLLGRSFAGFMAYSHDSQRFGAYLPALGKPNQFGLLKKDGRVDIVNGTTGFKFLPRLTTEEGCWPFFHGDYLHITDQYFFVDVANGKLLNQNGQFWPACKSYLIGMGTEVLVCNHWESKL